MCVYIYINGNGIGTCHSKRILLLYDAVCSCPSTASSLWDFLCFSLFPLYQSIRYIYVSVYAPAGIIIHKSEMSCKGNISNPTPAV